MIILYLATIAFRSSRKLKHTTLHIYKTSNQTNKSIIFLFISSRIDSDFVLFYKRAFLLLDKKILSRIGENFQCIVLKYFYILKSSNIILRSQKREKQLKIAKNILKIAKKRQKTPKIVKNNSKSPKLVRYGQSCHFYLK